MLSGLSSRMSGLDKGGGLDPEGQKDFIQETLLTLCSRQGLILEVGWVV